MRFERLKLIYYSIDTFIKNNFYLFAKIKYIRFVNLIAQGGIFFESNRNSQAD